VQQWLNEADEVSRAGPRRRWKQWMVAASVAVLTAALGTMAYLRLSFTHYETRVGEQRDVVLEDGSRVTLNTDTAISVRYSRNKRFIELTRGEALFSVQHDANRPFDVLAGRVLTRALGTEFNVDLRSTRLTVSVLEGAVRVTQEGASGSADPASAGSAGTMIPTALGKGQALEFRPNERLVREERTDRRRIDAWRARRIEFSDTPLATAVEEFNRYSTQRIFVGTPELGAVRVSGMFRIGDTEAFLFTLREALNIETHDTQGGIVLIRTTNPL
jgi:transmembrane sensor